MTTGFGIVGCGMISNFHAQAIDQIDDAEIVACFDTYAPGAERFAEQHGVTGYTDLDKMLADDRVDIINICTPSGAHRDAAVAAANAGKHVVVEKPLEITLQRCDDIINACRDNNVKLCTILPSRFSPANQALKAAIDSGKFGHLTLGDTYVKWWRSQEYYDSGGWRGTWKLDGGGSYMNQAIHNVDLIYWFMGEVESVSALTSTVAHERIEVEDVGVAALKFKNGALGTIEATTAAYPGLLKRTEIHGTKGSVVVEQDDVALWDFESLTDEDYLTRGKFAAKVGGTGGASDPSAISPEGHRKQLADLIEAIAEDRDPLVNGPEGRKSVEIILAIYQSSWTGQRVDLPLAKDPDRPA